VLALPSKEYGTPRYKHEEVQANMFQLGERKCCSSIHGHSFIPAVCATTVSLCEPFGAELECLAAVLPACTKLG